MSETRKIAAILVADVVGYSRLAGGDRFCPQLIGRHEGGMRDGHAQGWRKARRLRRPIGEQRSGRDKEAGEGVGLPPVQRQEQGEHLDGLAQSHVVGETGAETKPSEEAKPPDADILVRPQHRVQSGARIGGRQPFGAAAGIERFGEPRPRRHMPPLRGGRWTGGIAADIGAGQQAHRLRKGHALLARHALDRLEFIERRPQPLMIDLDPFAP